MGGTLVALDGLAMYSFGDSTAFPLRDNFLDTLTRTVQAAAELFAVECELETAEQKVHGVNAAIAAELHRHESLEVALNLALGQAQGTLCKQTATALQNTLLSILQRARQTLVAERERLTQQATLNDKSIRVKNILASLWLNEQLPHTKWSYRWRLDPAGALVELHAQLRGMTASFAAKPQGDSIWNREIPVSALLPSLQIQIPVWSRRSKGTQTKKEELADFSIIEIESSLARQRLLLRRNGKAKVAILVTLSDAAQSHPSISLVDEQQGVLGDSHQIPLPDLEELHRLWSLVQEHQGELQDSRSELTNLCVDNRSFETIDHPSEIAEMLLACIAPLVREIRLRSRVPGELILKRNTGAGRREELFLPRETLQAIYEHLPDRYTRVFDAMGLGQESTRELVTMLSDESEQKSQRQRSSRVVSNASDARPSSSNTPPRKTAASLAIEKTLAELSGSDADGEFDDQTLDEPSIIVEFSVA